MNEEMMKKAIEESRKNKDIYFANSAEQAGKIGFRDDMIYDFIKSDKKNKNILNMERIESKEAMEVFDEFENNPDKIMY